MNWQIGQKVYDYKYKREGTIDSFDKGHWVIKFISDTVTMWGKYKPETMGVRFELLDETVKPKEEVKVDYTNVIMVDFANKKKVV